MTDSFVLLEAACGFADAACCVIPTKTDGSKAPAVQWKAKQSDPPTVEQLNEWFASGNYDGFGVVCGTISGNLEMLEFEGRAVHLFGDWLQALTDNGLTGLRDRLTTGYLERTPSGGLHLLYRVSDAPAERNVKLARRPSTGAELAVWKLKQQAGIDREPEPLTRQKRQAALDRIVDGVQVPKVMIETRGQGGYVVVAPSAGRTHPSGEPWVMLAGGPASIPLITAEERTALYQLAESLDEMPHDAADTTMRSQPGNDAPLGEGHRRQADIQDGDELRPGDDYNRRATWEDILEPHGWHKMRNTFAGPGQSWARPGKDEPGASATTGTAESGDRLYVFSTSTVFESERPYSKFAAYCELEHGGDFAAATRELRRTGYGTPLPESRGNLTLDGTEVTGPLQPPPPEAVGATGEGPSGGDGSGVPPPPAGATSGPPSPYGLHDVGNAMRFVDEHQDAVRYCSERGKWLRWVGTHWQWDDANEVKELAKGISLGLPSTSDPAVKKHRLYSLSMRGLSNMINAADSDPRIRISSTQLDSYRLQLNTPGGAVDLVTGQNLGSDPTLLHSRITPYAPSYDPPERFLHFLSESLLGDAEMVAYIQRLAGYSATGVVTHHVFPFLWGPGGNGKGVLGEVLGRALGTYASVAPRNFLMATQNEKHPVEIARLDGVRLVICSEVNQRDRFDEAKMKELTGGNMLTANFMRQDPFDFWPSHKLWLMGNHQPRVDGGGESFWRRCRLIEFPRVVPAEEKNVHLAEELLAAEGPQILGWIIQGARAMLAANSLGEPEKVLEATAGYEEQEDALARFVQDCLRIGAGELVRVHTGDMRSVYEGWCHTNGEKAISAQLFGRELKRFQIGQARSNGKRFYTNVTVMTDGSDDESSEERERIWGR